MVKEKLPQIIVKMRRKRLFSRVCGANVFDSRAEASLYARLRGMIPTHKHILEGGS